VYIIYYFCYLFPKDIKQYQQDLDQSKKTTPSQAEISPATQIRNRVQKDLWHFNGSQRLHYQIRSDHSTLLITSSHHKISLQESMDNVVCMIQDKLYEDASHHPLQQLKILSAAHGIYNFNNHHFEADRVFINFYTMGGFALPENLPSQQADLQGIAKTASFTFANQGLCFHAEKFKAQLHTMDPL
ncbi:MAG: hypothetical protein WCG10_07925, partial [Chlamydiota bacterium]